MCMLMCTPAFPDRTLQPRLGRARTRWMLRSSPMRPSQPFANRLSLISVSTALYLDATGRQMVWFLPLVSYRWCNNDLTTTLVIPDYAKLRYIVRAPTWAELEVLRERVRACFE